MFTSIYLPIGVPTFDQDAARAVYESSLAALRELDANVQAPEAPLLSSAKVAEFLHGKQADLVVLQNVTFANGQYTAEVLRNLDCPVLLWTPEEPASEGRLKLNALTGAFSAGNMLTSFGRRFVYVYGSADDADTKKSLAAVYAAANVRVALKALRLLQIGYTPEGFGFGRAADSDVMRTFGSQLISIEARELIDRAQSYRDEEAAAYLADAKERIRALDTIDEKNVLAFARLYKAYDTYVKENGIGALSSRCWPDFFTAYGTPVCAALAMLNDLCVPAACETDTYGALSMFVAAEMTGKPAFFGDPVALHMDENSVTFWHCGTAACSLAREDTGACAGVHCNRKIGPTLEFGCKPEKEVTVLRIGRDGDGHFRILTARGEALDKPKQYYGTTVVVKLAHDAADFVQKGVEYGWEPHFVVAMGDISEAVADLGKFLGIEVFGF